MAPPSNTHVDARQPLQASGAGTAPPERIFCELRPRLLAQAYRMLGARADAEDVVQDAWLRWQAVDLGTLRSETAWLVVLTNRLAIDRLRARRRERPVHHESWLPDGIENAELDRTFARGRI